MTVVEENQLYFLNKTEGKVRISIEIPWHLIIDGYNVPLNLVTLLTHYWPLNLDILVMHNVNVSSNLVIYLTKLMKLNLVYISIAHY